jgi:hypothetical protein
MRASPTADNRIAMNRILFLAGASGLCIALNGVAWADAGDTPSVCHSVSVYEGDPIPKDACGVNILPRKNPIKVAPVGNGTVPSGGQETRKRPRAWVVLDKKEMPNITYDRNNVERVSGSPRIMKVDVLWAFKTPQIPDDGSAPYSATMETIEMNCTEATYTLTQNGHYADARGANLIEYSNVVAENLPIESDDVVPTVKRLVCPASALHNMPAP